MDACTGLTHKQTTQTNSTQNKSNTCWTSEPKGRAIRSTREILAKIVPTKSNQTKATATQDAKATAKTQRCENKDDDLVCQSCKEI
jgi:DNA-directed RNA polymerase subunit E'/Rpb7